MGTLYLVRHGQASFGADDYDCLSPLGERQCRHLGAWFAGRGVRFEAALVGSLRRQAQSLAAIEQGLGSALPCSVWPGLNEYDSAAVIATVHAGPLHQPTDEAQVRAYFRLLRDGLLAWTTGRTSPAGMPSFQAFSDGVRGALDHVRQHCSGNVLLVSSGGPIATAIGQVLATPPETAIELNLRIRNSAVTELTFNPKRYALITFNALPHLDHEERRAWETYT